MVGGAELLSICCLGSVISFSSTQSILTFILLLGREEEQCPQCSGWTLEVSSSDRGSRTGDTPSPLLWTLSSALLTWARPEWSQVTRD